MIIRQQLKKGVLDIIVLHIIGKGDIYGYDLIRQIDARSSQYFSLKEGSLYPILYRLEDKELIESYRKEPEGKRGVPRKYYTITTEGRSVLSSMIDEWSEFSTTVSSMLDH